jgi:hypothetical protein
MLSAIRYLMFFLLACAGGCASHDDVTNAPGTEGELRLTLVREDGTQDAIAFDGPPGEFYFNFTESTDRCDLSFQASSERVGDLRDATKAKRQRLFLRVDTRDVPALLTRGAATFSTRAAFLLDPATLELERATSANTSDRWRSVPGGTIRVSAIAPERGADVQLEFEDVPMVADDRNTSKQRLLLRGRALAKLRALAVRSGGAGCPEDVPGR